MNRAQVSSSPAPPGESSSSAVVVLSLDDDDDGASSTVRSSSPSVRHPKRRRADPPVAADSPPVIDLTSETVDLTVPLPNVRTFVDDTYMLICDYYVEFECSARSELFWRIGSVYA